MFFPTFIALVLVSCPLSIAQTLRQKTFYTIPEHALVGSVIATYQVQDEFACCHKCAQNTRCLSFNYGITTNSNLSICEISISEQVLDRERLLKKSNFIYHGSFVSIISLLIFKTSDKISYSYKRHKRRDTTDTIQWRKRCTFYVYSYEVIFDKVFREKHNTLGLFGAIIRHGLCHVFSCCRVWP